MRWVEHVAFAGEMRNSYTVLVINLHGRRNLEDLDVDSRIILKQNLIKHNERFVLDVIGSGYGPVSRSFCQDT
jgi:16S rRNA G1207 methylase RsmC